jgi:hypothetical protein
LNAFASPCRSNCVTHSSATPPALKGSRTGFRDEPEHHRSAAKLAPRLCKKYSASSRKTCPERSGGRAPLAEKGVRGKGRQPLSPPQHTVARSANSAPNRRINFRMADILPEHESGSSSAVLPRSEGIPRVRMEIVSEWRKCDRWGGTDAASNVLTCLPAQRGNFISHTEKLLSWRSKTSPGLQTVH